MAVGRSPVNTPETEVTPTILIEFILTSVTLAKVGTKESLLGSLNLTRFPIETIPGHVPLTPNALVNPILLVVTV